MIYFSQYEQKLKRMHNTYHYQPIAITQNSATTTTLHIILNIKYFPDTNISASRIKNHQLSSLYKERNK
jgi:hypothetical protein